FEFALETHLYAILASAAARPMLADFDSDKGFAVWIGIHRSCGRSGVTHQRGSVDHGVTITTILVGIDLAGGEDHSTKGSLSQKSERPPPALLAIVTITCLENFRRFTLVFDHCCYSFSSLCIL